MTGCQPGNARHVPPLVRLLSALSPQVVSTVVGSTIALAFGWLLAPWYASQRMLSDQADALRAALSLLRSMLAEVADAAAEGRAVRAAGWLEVVESDVQVCGLERGALGGCMGEMVWCASVCPSPRPPRAAGLSCASDVPFPPPSLTDWPPCRAPWLGLAPTWN